MAAAAIQGMLPGLPAAPNASPAAAPGVPPAAAPGVPLAAAPGVPPDAAQGSSPRTGAADFVSLDLDAAALDLSDRGVAGAPQPGPLDAFLWTDRGIYRPGETLHLTALLRDNGGRPVMRPAHLRVLRPNGQVFADSVAQDGGGGSLSLPVTLSAGAPAGIWTAQVLDDQRRPGPGETPPPALAGAQFPTLASVQFKVDAFVPDRMAVTIGALPDPLAAGTTVPVPIDARFLYGAAAAHLSGSASLRLGFAEQPPPGLAGYQVGLADEILAPQASTFELPPTDDAGRTILPLRLASLPDTTHAMQASLDVGIDDPSGHATHAPATLAVRPAGDLIGIRPLFGDAQAGNARAGNAQAGNARAGGARAEASLDEGAEAGFDIAAIGPDGARAALPVTVRLVRERPDWRLVRGGSGLSSYETVWRDEPLETHELTIPAEGALRFARRLDFGRYRLEVAQKGGLAASSVRFRSGWASSDSPDVPDRADVSADRAAYLPGAVARVHVAAPFAGAATLLVLTDRVVSSRLVDVPAGGADFDVPVDAAWGPGAYVALHVFRGGGRDGGTGDGSGGTSSIGAGAGAGGTGAGGTGDGGAGDGGAGDGGAGSVAAGGAGARPDRAIGVAWLGLDPAARRLDVAFEAPEVVRPRATAHAVLRTAPGAWVSVTAVDEGILRLTGFASPDPGPHFLGRRALGVDIRDDWGRLIAPAQGTPSALRQGGDEAAARQPNIPQHIVSLFQPPVQADAQGRVDVALPFPDFDGQVRLMAVAWDGTRLGAASAEMLVRDRLVAEPLLPRFLAPGDTARLAVLLHDLELPEGAVTVRVSTDGPLSVQGEPTLSVPLAPGAQAVPTLLLRAGEAGLGHVILDVAGPDGFQARHEVALDVHSARPQGGAILGASLAPGETQSLSPPFADFIAGTWRASAAFGGPVRYDASAMVRALDAYPLFCLEQATSKGLPLATLPDGVVAGPDRAPRLQRMVAAVLDRERYDGGFGLWSATDEAEPWLSSYATEFLLRARRAGADVGEAGLADALRFQAEQARDRSSTPEGLATQAYALYVLALAGQPRAGAGRVLFEALDTLPTPLARAQLAAALALGNDAPRAGQAFAAALDAPARAPWAFDYGDALRDQAATALLLRESGLLPGRLASLLARMPGADAAPARLDTQQQAWLAAAAGVLGRAGEVARISLDDRALPPAPVVTVALHGDARVRNTGDRAVWQSVSISGVPAQAPPAARSAMRISRRFFALDGTPLDLAHLRQNTVFVLLLEGAAEDAQAHAVQLLQGLPAGWEIAGRLAAGDVPGLPWLGTLSATTATPAADDRFQAVLRLGEDTPAFRIAVRLRAVTPGNFEFPGAEVSDMYRPGVFARQGDNRIDVLPDGR